jgi:hypothetical protein
VKSIIAALLLVLTLAGPALAGGPDIWVDRSPWLDRDLRDSMTFLVLGVGNAMDWVMQGRGCQPNSYSANMLMAAVEATLLKHPDMNPRVAVLLAYSRTSGCGNEVMAWIKDVVGPRQ